MKKENRLKFLDREDILKVGKSLREYHRRRVAYVVTRSLATFSRDGRSSRDSRDFHLIRTRWKNGSVPAKREENDCRNEQPQLSRNRSYLGDPRIHSNSNEKRCFSSRPVPSRLVPRPVPATGRIDKT